MSVAVTVEKKGGFVLYNIYTLNYSYFCFKHFEAHVLV